MLTASDFLVAAVAALSLLDVASSQRIESDLFFYGQSPPVYPSPSGKGTDSWKNAYSKARALVSQMTLDEKNNLTYGVMTAPNSCVGNIPAISRLEFPGMCLHDAGNGVRATDFVNGYPASISLGSRNVPLPWNKDLVHKISGAMAGEFRKKGINVALAPSIGPLGRLATGGRNWEGFGSDPYIAGILAAVSIEAIHKRGVMTSTKHWIGNEQETMRNVGRTASGDPRNSISSNIDDKTMHELYMWPFADALHAGAVNIMCSYQKLNNSYACANSKSLNGLLKTELGFQGFVVSDWYALHTGVAAAEAGLDMVMPFGGQNFGANITAAIRNGTLAESRLTDMATRIIAAWYKVGLDVKDFPALGVGMPIDIVAPHPVIDAREKSSKPLIFQGAVEGHVLVKNTGSLPLQSPKLLSIFGYDAKSPDTYNIGPIVSAWQVGFNSGNWTAAQPSFMGMSNNATISQNAPFGTVFTGGGAAGNTPPYLSSPFEALSQKAYDDDSMLLWDFSSIDPSINGATSACLVFINAFASEIFDRTAVRDAYSDTLVTNVAKKCSNTIVIIHNAGTRLVDSFIEHPNVTAVVFAHVPGQDSGRALVSLLYGDSSFSGKLTYTVAKNESDYGDLLLPDLATPEYERYPQSNFTEGVYIDYRAFDQQSIEPRFEFGFGLTYTKFSYKDLRIKKKSRANISLYPSGPIESGGQNDLWDVLYEVTAMVANTGSRDGAEVAQLYVGIPGGPVKQLRGFEKLSLKKGSSKKAVFELRRRDLSEWDVQAQMWRLQKGVYKVWVGESSRKLDLEGEIRI